MAIAASGGGGGIDPKMQAALNALVAGSGGTGLGGGKVYMGKGYNSSYGGPHGGSSSVAPDKGHDLWTSKTEAENDYYNWSTKKQSDFVAQGILSGLLNLGDGPLVGANLWKKLVKEAANYGAVGKKVTPFDLMASYVQASGGANAWKSQGVWEINTVTGERRYVGPGTYLGGGKAQQVDTRVDLTDPDTAKAISTKMFQDLMGRDPGAGELGAFASALHQAEESNPVVATTTTQYDMDTGQALSSSTTSSGGVSAEAKQYIQEQKIKKSKEYGAYQAATTYQNALENLVFGSPE
jgi:hypothetical protein